MTDLWYFNVKNIDKEAANQLVNTLPRNMIKEVLRFRNNEDRLLKLFGKLIVKKYYDISNYKFHWEDWMFSLRGKPYYNNGHIKFNISHSGQYVLAAFSDHEIGVDIERISDFDIMSVIDYLHPAETKYIENAYNQRDAFFRIWTRKEAFLKARGTGIIDGLNNENCLNDELINVERWFLYSFSFIPDYKIGLCTQNADSQINILKLSPLDFSI